jgi:hypothetical protein
MQETLLSKVPDLTDHLFAVDNLVIESTMISNPVTHFALSFHTLFAYTW